MFRGQKSDEAPLLETIQLTAKLQKSLRRLMSSRRYNLDRTANQERTGQGVIEEMQRQIQLLKQQNVQLQADNQQICRDVLRLRDQNRDLKKELNQHKKYITHLQGYNEDLKKELLFWMRKPSKHEQSGQKDEDSVGGLMNEVFKLRRENQARQLQLNSLRKTVSVKQIPVQMIKKFSLPIEPLIKKKTKQTINKRVSTKPINQCTSCNYRQSSSNRRKKTDKSKTSSFTTGHKKKALSQLCQCHRNYLETSQFRR